MPFSFLYFWAAVRATGDVRNGLKAAADICGSESRSLPLARVFCEIIEEARQGEKIDLIVQGHPEVKIFQNVYFFFSSLNFFAKGIAASGRIEDLHHYYRNRRTTRETATKVLRFVHAWTLSNLLYDIAGYLKYQGINWMIPIITVHVGLIALFLLGIPMSFSLLWAVIAVFFMWGLSYIRSAIRRSMEQHERELVIILRPFHARLRQGVHPLAALTDVYGFLRRGSVLEQQFDAVISYKGGYRDSAEFLRDVARMSPSPVVERFWLALALALVTQAEIAQLIDELALEVYKK